LTKKRERISAGAVVAALVTFGKLFGRWLISWQNATDSNRHNLLKSQG
jgi:hypothetical protein